MTRVKLLIMGDDEGTNSTDGKTAFLFTLFPEIRTADPGKLQIERIPTLSTIVDLDDRAIGIGAYTMEEVQRLGSDEALLAEVRMLQPQLSCHDTFMLGFTSGSTGQPKCVEQSTYALHNNIRFIGKAIGMPKEGTALYPYLSFRYAVIYPFTAGCTLVVPANMSPSAVDIMEIIQEERCKAIGVLYLKDCHGLLHDPHLSEYDLSSLMQVLVTGNITPKSLVDHAAKVLPNAKMIVGYGGTEFLFLTSMAAEMVVEGKQSTVGKLLQHAEMRIVDKDGQVVPLGHEGEVYVRGYSLFNRYRGDKEKTSKAMTGDGWYKTGDVGVLDEEGVLKLLGRVWDMIIRNAHNVHPTVVESNLSRHPKVQDVRVVGVPDAASVEEICACVILKEGQTADSQEMMKFCAKIELLDATAARWPDREAYVFKKTGARVTFRDIQEKATRLAAGLKAIGTARGDVVAWLFGHRPEWIYVYFAVAKLGAIVLPLRAERIGRNVEATKYFLTKVIQSTINGQK
ncbi:ACSF2 [Branchiostoma lanceolatum]|uniref:ACSF2 protein n=1 Tax=Branchiostoma lanceolatum TaxID=7740 RepID=A0A8K0EK71_BRALA|nr:ACSF2 [Branchiostoma lanceolatum]